MVSVQTRRVAAVLLLAVVPAVSGCGLVFGGTRQVVRANSSPDGATIATTPTTADYKTPSSMSLERKNNYTLTFSMPGYTSEKFELQKSIRGGIVVLDIVLGLVPVIVDAATGAWYKLSPDVATVTLNRAGPGSGPEQIQVSITMKPTDDRANVRIDGSVPGVRVAVRQK
jgi:hypothetical protein